MSAAPARAIGPRTPPRESAAGQRTESRSGAARPLVESITILWEPGPEGGPIPVWHPVGEIPGFDATAVVRIFKHLESPVVDACLIDILRSDPSVYWGLAAAIPPGAGCRGGDVPAVSRAYALWSSFGFDEALAEVARDGTCGPKVEAFLARCAELRP